MFGAGIRMLSSLKDSALSPVTMFDGPLVLMPDALWDKDHYGKRPYSSDCLFGILSILSIDVRIVQDMTPVIRLTRAFDAGVEVVVDSIMGS